MASTVVLGGKTVESPPAQLSLLPQIDAKIEIVWPHENKPVEQAAQVNIGASLFRHQTLHAIGPSWDGSVKLWRALNNGVEEQVATGTRRLVSAAGLQFPAWDFNDVDVSQAQDPLNKYYFRLSVDGAQGFTSIWSHGADARTFFPKTDVPTGITSGFPQAVDAKVEVVWPHDNLPVDQASQVNIAAYLFDHGTLNSVSTEFTPTVRLWRSLNNGPGEEIGRAEKVMKTEGGITFPVWQFTNINVKAAQDPINKYYFRLTVDGVRTYSNIWCHGEDGRTYFPNPDVPTSADE
jgi:hypothetical protein